MDTPVIHLSGILFAFLLLAIPIVIMHKTRLPMVRETVWSFLRMSVQLALAGVFLTVLFEYNNPFLNVLWLCEIGRASCRERV